jgi:hypothetical protein
VADWNGSQRPLYRRLICRVVRKGFLCLQHPTKWSGRFVLIHNRIWQFALRISHFSLLHSQWSRPDQAKRRSSRHWAAGTLSLRSSGIGLPGSQSGVGLPGR